MTGRLRLPILDFGFFLDSGFLKDRFLPGLARELVPRQIRPFKFGFYLPLKPQQLSLHAIIEDGVSLGRILRQKIGTALVDRGADHIARVQKFKVYERL